MTYSQHRCLSSCRRL